MRKPLTLFLTLLLSLCLTSCAPVAEVTPSPTPTETVTPNLRPGPRPTFAPVPKPTETPTPTPTPEPTPEPTPAFYWGGDKYFSAHYWSDDGYCYTSKALGIKLKFPPQWEEYFTIEEGEGKVTLHSETGEWVKVEGTYLRLIPKGVDLYGEIYPLASIFWVPKGMSFDVDSGAWLTLAETEEGSYVCSMWTMLQLELHPEWDKPLTREYLIVESVQNGIIDGRWEIEVLEK